MTENELTHDERREAFARRHADSLAAFAAAPIACGMIPSLEGPCPTYEDFLEWGRADFDRLVKAPKYRSHWAFRQPTSNGTFTDLLGEY